MDTNNISTNENLIHIINDLKKEISDIKKVIDVLVQNKDEKDDKKEKNVTYFVIKENQVANDMNHKIDILMQKLDGKNETKNVVTEDNDQIKREENVKSTKKKTKAEKYQKERKDFINKLEKIMGLTETERGVLLYDLENNDELKKYLKDKIADIQKFYNYNSWNYFKNLKNTDSGEIGLLKSILKNENYNIMNKQVLKEINGIKKMYSVLYFIKNINGKAQNKT